MGVDTCIENYDQSIIHSIERAGPVHQAEIIANNIANAQTPGFKGQQVASSFAQALESEIGNLGMLRDRPPYPDSPSAPRIVSM